jgi:hypothetical protein
MDEFEQLVDAYRTQASSWVASRLSVLIDLERSGDPRLLPFLLNVLADPQETAKVRICVLKQLRNARGLVAPADRPAAANAAGEALVESSNAELRIQAALTLGDFTDMGGVVSRLSAVCLAEHESIDLRYAAFTSLQRVGTTPESIALLRQISADETLGLLAQSVLSAWHIE